MRKRETSKDEERDYNFPIPILIDKQEQRPFSFAGINADEEDGGGKVAVETKITKLFTGDYTLEGFEEKIAIERKSKGDLYRSISRERDRFEREISRMNAFDHAFVVIECSLGGLLKAPPFTQVEPKNVLRTIYSWKMRYRGVQWMPFDNRRLAEIQTFRILRLFYKGIEHERKRERLAIAPMIDPDELEFTMEVNRLTRKLKRYPNPNEIVALIRKIGWSKSTQEAKRNETETKTNRRKEGKRGRNRAIS